jgi:hypothetical protein
MLNQADIYLPALPPTLSQDSLGIATNPIPLQEPFSLQALVAVLRSLKPLHLLKPYQCTSEDLLLRLI